jgi:hypothetical protein
VRKIIDYLKTYYKYHEYEETVDHMRFACEEPGQDAGTAEGAAVHYLLFVKHDAKGRTLAEKWQVQGWPGLNNDERIMLESRLNCRATVIEIEKILDHQRMECIDLLEPKRDSFILVDRATAGRCVRFTRLLTWLAHYPNFSRIANNGLEVSDFVFGEFMEVLRHSFKKESRKNKWLSMKDYLSENFGVFCSLIYDLNREKSIAVLEAMDMHQCKAFYKIKGNYADVKAVLDNNPDFERREKNSEEKEVAGAHYYSWLRRGQSRALEKEMSAYFRHTDEREEGVGTLGNVTLSSDKLIVEVFTKQKYAFAKKMLGKFFGDNLLLQREAVVDLAKQEALRMDENYEDYAKERTLERDKSNSENIPPEILRELIQKAYKRHYAVFLNDKMPALNGMTPREAAENLQTRTKLIELMKQHLKGIEKQNKERGLDLNIDWVLDELSLTELR